MTTPSEIEIDVIISSADDPENLDNVASIFTGQSTSGRTRGNVRVEYPDNHHPEWDDDYRMVVDAFQASGANSYVIVSKDAIVAGASSQTIFDVLESTIDSSHEDGSKDFDIFYLAKWADSCEKYTNDREVGGRGLRVVDTVSPNGVLCMMFSPMGRAKFLRIFDPDTNPVLKNSSGLTLGHYIRNQIGKRPVPSAEDPHPVSSVMKLYASTSYPSLVNFDIRKRKNDAEMIKTIECRGVPSDIKPIPKNTSSNMGFFWFIVIVIVVLIIAWGLIRFASNATSCSKNTLVGSNLQVPPIISVSKSTSVY